MPCGRLLFTCGQLLNKESKLFCNKSCQAAVWHTALWKYVPCIRCVQQQPRTCGVCSSSCRHAPHQIVLWENFRPFVLCRSPPCSACGTWGCKEPMSRVWSGFNLWKLEDALTVIFYLLKDQGYLY